MEAFEVSDYDLQTEFDPSARHGHRPSRHERIYGVFGEDSGDEAPVRKAKKSYTTPVGFVKGGVQQAGEPKAKRTSDDEDEGRAPIDSSDEDVPRADMGLPRAFSSAPRQRRFDGASSAASQQREEMAGMRSLVGAGPSAGIGALGHWEKHTRGIGAKLLKQMGFQAGSGLGKNLQGIVNPVEAKLRKGRAAVGAYGREQPAAPAPTAPEPSAPEPEREFREKLGQWRRGGAKRNKVGYVYKTVSEVLAEGKSRTLGSAPSASGDRSEMSRVKVIDMTGRELRVLSGYHAIHGGRGPQEPASPSAADDADPHQRFNLPELLHNINLLVDICEQDIIRMDRSVQHERDRQVALEHEETQLTEAMSRQQRHLERLEDIQEVVDRLEAHKPDTVEPHTLTDVIRVFKYVRTEYPAEYESLELDHLSVDYVYPLVAQQLLADWKPTVSPRHGIDAFHELRDLLQLSERCEMDGGVPVDVYHRLLWQCWMPSVRSAVVGWQPKLQPLPLTELLDAWRPLLPGWIWGNVCDQLILPRLQTEVDAWNPLTDTVPIHSWIHPWMPLLDDRLEVVYPTIRQKLSNALMAWHPSDRSARLIIAPWVGVMSPSTLEAFLVKNIVPKLQLAMTELVINPHQQVIDQWKWVMDWEDLISPVHLVSILDKVFFPKWLQVLVNWLNHVPNYEEVTKWYLGWKQMIPERLLGHATIREHLNTGLQFMNRSASNPTHTGVYQPPVPPAPGLSAAAQSATPGVLPAAPESKRNAEDLSSAVRAAAGSVVHGFRDLLERRCQERGIILVPLPNKYHLGKPIYRCGTEHIYLDRSVIFVNERGVWVPTSLQTLLDKAVI